MKKISVKIDAARWRQHQVLICSRNRVAPLTWRDTMHLRMPEGTLRSWVVGRWYPVAGQSKRSRPLIHLDDPQRQYLSFINVVEAHVLAAIRRRHGVKLPKVRTALDYVKRQFHIERPLIDQTFQTDGLDIGVHRNWLATTVGLHPYRKNSFRSTPAVFGKWRQPRAPGAARFWSPLGVHTA